MKKASLLFSLLGVLFFSSCSKDDDASILQGTWESTEEIVFDVVTSDPEASRLIGQELRRLSGDNYFVFAQDGSFDHFFTFGKTAGNYFQKSGKYIIRFLVPPAIHDSSMAEAIMEGQNQMFIRFDSSKRFTAEELERMNIQNPHQVTVSKAGVTFHYIRK